MEPQPQNTNPSLPEQPVAPSPQPVSSSVSSPIPPTAPKSSSNKVVWIVVGSVIALFILLIVVVFGVVAYSGIQKRASGLALVGDFYALAQKGPSDELFDLFVTEGRSESFITNAAQNVDDSCTVDASSMEYNDTTKEEDATIKGNCDKTKGPWKFTIVQEPGTKGWKIQGIVFSGGAAVDPTQIGGTVSDRCLTEAEAKSIGFTGIVALNPEGFITSKTIFFEADSAEYSFPNQDQAKLDEIAAFYAQTSSKAYQIEVTAKTQEASRTSGGYQIAQDRSNKVVTYLTSKGVASDRITVLEPVVETGTNDFAKSARRNVNVAVQGKDCSSSSQR